MNLYPNIITNIFAKTLTKNDIRMPSGDADVLKKSLKNGRIHREHLEICAKRLLEMILKLD